MSRHEERVAFNPSGRYNMNFIDWDNEFENIADSYCPHMHESLLKINNVFCRSL